MDIDDAPDVANESIPRVNAEPSPTVKRALDRLAEIECQREEAWG